MTHDELRNMILAVNKAFYSRVYKDPWLKLVFQTVSQEHIENQQTDFMVGAMGGPRLYCGRNPTDAHPHIFVTEEMWQLREKYLKEAFMETQFPEDLSAKWLKIDEAFKKVIVKKDPSECKKRYGMDEIINISNPKELKKAG